MVLLVLPAVVELAVVEIIHSHHSLHHKSHKNELHNVIIQCQVMLPCYFKVMLKLDSNLEEFKDKNNDDINETVHSFFSSLIQWIFFSFFLYLFSLS